jgi:hypothetical protein
MAKEPTRTIRITYKDTEEGHADRDLKISKINNYLLKSRDEQSTYLFILDLGIQTALQQMANAGDLEAKMKSAIRDKMMEINGRDQRWSELNKLYDKMPSDEFQKWCEDNSINMAAFLEWREKKQADTWADGARRWLRDLLRDGNPIQTDAIRGMAIEAGIIQPENHQQWTYLRVIASREGFTSAMHGCWQMVTMPSDPGF